MYNQKTEIKHTYNNTQEDKGKTFTSQICLFNLIRINKYRIFWTNFIFISNERKNTQTELLSN